MSGAISRCEFVSCAVAGTLLTRTLEPSLFCDSSASECAVRRTARRGSAGGLKAWRCGITEAGDPGCRPLCNLVGKFWLPAVDILRNPFAAPTIDLKMTFELLFCVKIDMPSTEMVNCSRLLRVSCKNRVG